mmetsp:Transcript_42547/g.76439  ORF Transcript_42547/g.76439 Transcript_42547/m.76439 type:complete len:360 (+) Transcript_42547:34-1113(+)
MLAAVETGGTSCRCALARAEAPTVFLETAEFPTTTPADTINCITSWLASRRYDALGVASFGPIDPGVSSPKYGFITKTPKPGWRDVNLLGPLKAVRPGVPVMFDTDVNAPAMAEYLFGGGVECGHTSCMYVTVGTGVGVGLVVNGKPVHGLLHPEGGHIPVAALPGDDFPGYSFKEQSVPFGGLHTPESIASSVALSERLALAKGTSAQKADRSILASLPDNDPIWDHAANALASLAATAVLLVSPERIVLGGGIMQRQALFARIQDRVGVLLNGYLDVPTLTTRDGRASYIGPSQWGNDAGLVGALALAWQAHRSSRPAHECVASDINRTSRLANFSSGLLGVATCCGWTCLASPSKS